jgi:hypothetical protein
MNSNYEFHIAFRKNLLSKIILQFDDGAAKTGVRLSETE